MVEVLPANAVRSATAVLYAVSPSGIAHIVCADIVIDVTSGQSPQRKKRGVASSMLAGGLVAIENLLGRKPREDVAEIRESAKDEEDIDRHGITMHLDDQISAHSPAPAARDGAKRLIVRRRTR